MKSFTTKGGKYKIEMKKRETISLGWTSSSRSIHEFQKETEIKRDKITAIKEESNFLFYGCAFGDIPDWLPDCKKQKHKN